MALQRRPSRAVSPASGSAAQLEDEHERLFSRALSDAAAASKEAASSAAAPTTATYLQALFVLEHFWRATGCDDARLRDFMARLARNGVLDMPSISQNARELQRFVGGFLRALASATGDPRGDGRLLAAALASRTPSPSFAREFVALGPLGKGAFGSVVRAQRLLDGATYAVKRVPFEVRGPADRVSALLDRVLREARTLARLDHPNVVRYFTSWIEAVNDGEDEDGAAASMTHFHAPLMLPEPSTESRSSNDDGYCSAGWSNKEEDDEDGDGERFSEDEEEDDEEESLTATMEESSSTSSDDNGLKICFTEAGATVSKTLLPTTDTASTIVVRRASPASVVAAEIPPQRFVLYLQTQCVGGTNLRVWLDRRRGSVDAVASRKILRFILQGLQHIHACGVIHRDLKPANVLIDQNGPGDVPCIVKIVDFGLSTDLGSDTADAGSIQRQYSRKGLTAGVGTRPYAAPEQISRGLYTEKADLFSLGIIVLELFCVFGTGSERANSIADLKTRRTVPQEMLVCFPQEAELALSLTNECPSERPSAARVLESSMFQAPRPLISMSAPPATSSPGESEEDTVAEIARLRKALRQKEEELQQIRARSAESILKAS